MKTSLERPGLPWIDNIKMDFSWTGFIWLSIGSVVGFCEHGNDLSGCLKRRAFLEFPRGCRLPEKAPAAGSLSAVCRGIVQSKCHAVQRTVQEGGGNVYVAALFHCKLVTGNQKQRRNKNKHPARQWNKNTFTAFISLETFCKPVYVSPLFAVVT